MQQGKGNLRVLKFLIECVEKKEEPGSVKKMIHANRDLVFRCAARFGNLRILNFLIQYVNENEGAECIKEMIHADNDDAIRMTALWGQFNLRKIHI